MDEATFLAWLEQHQGILHKICRLYRDRPEDRQDLFQEIVYQLWRSAPAYRGAAQPGTWIYRIALNTAMATFRRRRPDIRYTPTLPDQAADTGKDPVQRQQEALYAALRRLEEADRALIGLQLEGLSYREIATITGITENHVGVKLNRIRRKLQQLLHPEND